MSEIERVEKIIKREITMDEFFKIGEAVFAAEFGTNLTDSELLAAIR